MDSNRGRCNILIISKEEIWEKDETRGRVRGDGRARFALGMGLRIMRGGCDFLGKNEAFFGGEYKRKRYP
jgi:hypothetical protein